MYKLFIDVDGVLVNLRVGNEPIKFKEYINQFVHWATSNFDCYWLTGWAVKGQRNKLETDLLPYLPPVAYKIKVAYWDKLKTEALDLSNKNWLWLDDCLLRNECEYLENNDCLRNFILIDPTEISLANTAKLIVDRYNELQNSSL